MNNWIFTAFLHWPYDLAFVALAYAVMGALVAVYAALGLAWGGRKPPHGHCDDPALVDGAAGTCLMTSQTYTVRVMN